jgi:DNA-binding response OmpR family regulator
MAPHVLVADDDAWILRMVATVLEKRGYSVETAVDGEDALERALARTPDLLITDVMMPKMDGWSLVRQLRSHAELALLPVIFLTALSSEDDRIRGFRLGADDYVTKPFRFEELDLRVAKTLRRAQQTQQDTRDQLSGSGLRGDLAQVGLSSLLVLIEMERKTGLLQMRAPGGPSGQILVRDGKVVHARLDDQEEPVDAECVYYMLTWGAGEFEFVACVVEGVDRVTVSTTHLLMEGARLMDEANEPSLQPAVTIPPRISQEFPAVEPDADLEEPATGDSSSISSTFLDDASASASSTEANSPSTADPAGSASNDESSTTSAAGHAASTIRAATDAGSMSNASSNASSTSTTSTETRASSNELSSRKGPASRKNTSNPGSLSSMWTLTGDDSVQVDESSSIDDEPSSDVEAPAPSPTEAADIRTNIPGSSARSSSPVIPTARSSDANDAPTIIPGLPTRSSSPVIPTAHSSDTNDAPTIIPGLPTRSSSPALDAGESSRATTPALAAPTTRASSPAIAGGSDTSRASSPSLAGAPETSRASSPSLAGAPETSRASSPSLTGGAETSRSSSPVIPPIPIPPSRKSTPLIASDKPTSVSGPLPPVDDPSDDRE